jgi:hypothetical protein
MLTVPPEYSLGYALLLATPSGSALLDSASLATAVGAINAIPGGAYGRAMAGDRLELTATVPPPPNQACLLAHELTHCLDMAFWNSGAGMITQVQLGATEINAHYNQGLIAKELMINPQLSAEYQAQVTAMMSGYATWSQMGRAWTREDVYAHLDGTAQYGDAVRALRAARPIYYWTVDDEWELGLKLFHCETHLDQNTRTRLGRLGLPHDPVW